MTTMKRAARVLAGALLLIVLFPTAAHAAVPGTPTNVQATAGDTEATVTWSAPASDGGSAINGYTVTSSPGNISASVGGSVLSAVVTGLTNGTSYTFTVVASNAEGFSAASAASGAATPSGIPTAPTAVTATAGNGEATVSWTASNANGATLTGYTVTSSPGGLTATVAGTATTATVTGLTNGTPYTFTVVATNARGTSAASSASAAVTPAGVPGAPTGVTATAGNAQATVSWTAPATGGSAITSYAVSCAASGQTTRTASTSGATTATVTSLTNGVEYTCTVTATNGNGTGAASTGATVTPIAGSPAAPTAVSATAGNGEATVSWTAANNNGSVITGNTVSCTPGPVTSTVGAVTSTTVTGLTNGTTYSCTVRATNSAGTGPASAAATVTPAGAPSVPTGVTAVAGDGQATVSWTAAAANGSSITGYRVRTFKSGLLDGAALLVAAPATSRVVTGLTNGSAYTFTVSAINAIGESAQSSASAAVTPAASSGGGGGGGGGGSPSTPAAPREVVQTIPVSTNDDSATAEFETSGGTVTVTLEGVDDAATVTVTVRNEPPERAGLDQLPVSYDIDVTGTEFDSVELQLSYDEDDVDALGLEESRLSLFHFDEAAVFDITTALDTRSDSISGTTTSLSPFSIGVPATDRIAGIDRYATASAVSAASYGAGAAIVYVATGAGFADALAGGPAAAFDRGPILLVERDAIPAATAAELARLQPDQIAVLGGTGAVSAAVEAALSAYAPDVYRLAGDDRYATAATVSRNVFAPGVAVAYLATGEGFADALAGGAAAALDGGPLLLTARGSLPDATADELARLAPGRVIVLGGDGVVGEAVLDAVEAVIGERPLRIGGVDRYATAAAISDARFGDTTTDAFVATGVTFPDALAAVPAAALRRAPVLLVPGTTVPTATSDELERLSPNTIVVLGGTGAISRQSETDISAFVRG